VKDKKNSSLRRRFIQLSWCTGAAIFDFLGNEIWSAFFETAADSYYYWVFTSLIPELSVYVAVIIVFNPYRKSDLYADENIETDTDSKTKSPTFGSSQFSTSQSDVGESAVLSTRSGSVSIISHETEIDEIERGEENMA